MSYQVLARKWRPRTFSELTGQGHVVTALSNALSRGQLHHAYLLTGTRGVGKTTIARILAKSLNCLTNGVTATPCGTCAACTDIDAGRFVDLLEIDAASNTGIDNMREILDNARYAPTVGRYKVYLIDEVHMLSKSAFNSMLKTLEEPPEHVKFVLATTDPQKVPVTVLSRCLQFALKPLSPDEIGARIATILKAEGIAHDDDAVALIARAASGSLRDGLSLLDQAIAFGAGEVRADPVRAMLGVVDREFVYRIADALAAGDGPALLAQADAIGARGSVRRRGARGARGARASNRSGAGRAAGGRRLRRRRADHRLREPLRAGGDPAPVADRGAGACRPRDRARRSDGPLDDAAAHAGVRAGDRRAVTGRPRRRARSSRAIARAERGATPAPAAGAGSGTAAGRRRRRHRYRHPSRRGRRRRRLRERRCPPSPATGRRSSRAWASPAWRASSRRRPRCAASRDPR